MSKPRKTRLQKLIDLLPPGRLETIQAASEADLQTMLATAAIEEHDLKAAMKADDDLTAAREQVKELSRTYREPLAVVAATVAVIQAHRTGGGW